MSRKRDRAHSNSASRPLHQHRSPRDVAPDMDGTVSRDAGYPEASAFVRRHVLRERGDMVERHNSELRGRPELAVRLGTVAPYSPTDPFGRYTFADLIHLPGAVAVRNDTWIR